MKIKEATEKDFKEIAKIIKIEYLKKPYFEKWTIKNAIKTLENYKKNSKIYIATSKKEIIGAIVIRQDYYNTGFVMIIEELIVKTDFQGKGIGNELINHVENYAKKNKTRLIILYANKKAKAYKFYKKRGYKHEKQMSYFVKEMGK